MSDQKGLNALTPKTAFTVGLVGGVLALCTVGFFILLSITLSGGDASGLFARKTDGAAREAVNQPSAAQPSPRVAQPNTPPPAVTDKDHIRGPKDAKLTLIEYSDFECPFCKRFYPTVQQVLTAYPKDVRVVFRHFPLSFHANAQKEAEASECAAELGGNDAFWKFHDKIFERTTSNGTGFALDALAPLAKEIGLNEGKFKECLDSGKYTQYVQDQLDSGAAAGVSGTPGTFVVGSKGSQLIPGALPFEQIKQVIDSLL